MNKHSQRTPLARKPAARRSAILAVFVALLLASLACNYPTAIPTQEQTISSEELRATLAAELYATAQALTPEPGAPPAAAPPPFPGLQTATPVEPALPEPQASPQAPTEGFEVYITQPGDTLEALAVRFGVAPDMITSPQPIPAGELIPPGQVLGIPNVVGDTGFPSALLPDSEVVNSPSTIDFDTWSYLQSTGGYLNSHLETQADGETLSGPEIVQRVVQETSTNPRFLLAFIEYRSGWVMGPLQNSSQLRSPLGFNISGQIGLYKELTIVATHLNLGYYGWRTGTQTELKFSDGSQLRISPGLNAGTVGVQNLFARIYKPGPWQEALYGPENFLTLHQSMFGDPWARAAVVEPLFPAGLAQPPLELPFLAGERWSLTGGPHNSWNTGSTLGALDFAPVTGEAACSASRVWTTAVAPGLVTRSGDSVVVIDLDGDGHEGTGWVILYLHLAERELVAAGAWVEADTPLGHPSCEGGRSTGTHVHIARRYNGEWIAADGPLPFVLSGWRAHAGAKPYQGFLSKDDQVVSASPGGARTSIVSR